MIAASLKTLLTNVIDYAGTFPPASLSLDQSIGNYARYLKEPDAWMLGRFICPAAKLDELLPHLDLFDEKRPLLLSVLGSAGDAARILAFQTRAGNRGMVQMLESRVEGAHMQKYEGAPLPVFVETTVTEHWRTQLRAQIDWVAGSCGFKLRTGGVEASAFPPAEQIAFAIAACRDKTVPIKFTAGLHHPIRHFNSSVNTKMHGFINVFLAGVLAHALNLNEEQLIPILLDENPASFGFDDDELRWKDYGASTRQIVGARRLVTSFGSCSFDEPREDLRSLGWL